MRGIFDSLLLFCATSAAAILGLAASAPADAALLTLNRAASGTLQLDSSHVGVYDYGTPEPIAAFAYFNPTLLFYQRRGIVEFDLSLISPLPNATVNLVLPDSGGFGFGDSTTNIYWYTNTADNTLTTADWDSAATFVTSITRPPSGPTTTLDVTGLINSLGGVNIGFRFEAVNIGTWQEDAFLGTHLDYDPNPVPEPSTFALGITALAGLGSLALRKKFRRV